MKKKRSSSHVGSMVVVNVGNGGGEGVVSVKKDGRYKFSNGV